ncbi:TetR/AcrR family transcriptional regulator [Marininema halotolerans]|uniref:DNA-binding transcriptional regulator, AcrR family n=1 Tax=Marininema halotolerans TaxID=1155944 RepID=A0A1I6QNL3_9BACL|nr:TetR/AcrR family transcriptional regulator [Marininema halotolerans]SFS53908.1 DNA-binding transcriptional regulator, AcrR family [Marininema halotolerans]
MRGFSTTEKDAIRQKLFREGRERFSQWGLKKTSIGELTRAVGISQGAFYLFFSSKEELYFDLLEQEQAFIQQELLRQVEETEKISPRSALKQFLVRGLTLSAASPLLHRLRQGEDLPQLLRKLPSDRLASHQAQDDTLLSPLLQQWGLTNEIDPDVACGLIRGFFTMMLHRQEIGEEVYEQTVELMAESIACRLIPTKEES